MRGLEELALAAEEVGRGSGEVDGARRPQRRELRRAELEELGRRVEVLEPVATEIAQRLVLDERGGRGREDHLAAVRERGDARAAVDVDPDVALGGHRRRARVQPHPDRDRARRERLLRRCAPRRRRPAAVGNATKNASPWVSTSTPPCGRERLAQDAAVLGQRLGVAVGPELAQQPRRALDVGEQERHRPAGQVLSHEPSMVDPRPHSAR